MIFKEKNIKFKKYLANFFCSLFKFRSIKLFFSCVLSLRTLPRSVNFPHPIGVVIGESVEIGENCIIYQNVTVGAKKK